MKIAKLCMWGLMAIGLLITPVVASAHDMWLTVDSPALDQPLRILANYGHAFPQGGVTEKEKVLPAYLLGPQGRIECQSDGGLGFSSLAPLAKGSYLVVGGRAAQWYSKTPEGPRDAPRNQVPGALSCLRSAKYAKAVVNLGGASGDLSRPVGQTLEIVPLANPASLKVGGELPLKVLFQGQPLVNAEVRATFAGFTKEGESFAFAGHTDQEGRASVKVWHPGSWLVVVKHELAFADSAQCDKDMHAATLTFVIK